MRSPRLISPSLRFSPSARKARASSTAMWATSSGMPSSAAARRAGNRSTPVANAPWPTSKRTSYLFATGKRHSSLPASISAAQTPEVWHSRSRPRSCATVCPRMATSRSSSRGSLRPRCFSSVPANAPETMSKAQNKPKKQSAAAPVDIQQYSTKTDRKHRIWFNGEKHDLDVYRIPTKYLHFNIQNGRYADKMMQLKVENPGESIDPRLEKWRNDISRMLRGEYPGTQDDREPWERLCADIRGKSQLHPGVVIADGGVIDGNRRLSVLLSLATDRSEKNATRFEYFEGVILPENVSDEDRWRIEAGQQLGKDEKQDYSSINKILKIKEGLRIFGEDETGIREIASAMYGTKEKEIRDIIKEINLIDEYLIYLEKPGAYKEVAGLTERFLEAVNTLEAAKNNGFTPQQFGRLKLVLF